MGAVGQDTALAYPAWPVYTQCVRAWRSEIAAKKGPWLLDLSKFSFTRTSHLSERSATGGSRHSEMCGLAPSTFTPVALCRLVDVLFQPPVPHPGARTGTSTADLQLQSHCQLCQIPPLGSHDPSNDRAKSMLPASVGVKVVLEPPRRRFGSGWAVLTRPAISRKKATQDLGTTPTQAKRSTSDTDDACGRRGCIFSRHGIEALPVRL